jgi:hypothetical protein
VGLTADTVNLAGSLVRLAGRFEAEATGWGDYTRVRTGDLVHGEAWLSAAALVLTHLEFARLFRDGRAWVKLS